MRSQHRWSALSVALLLLLAATACGPTAQSPAAQPAPAGQSPAAASSRAEQPAKDDWEPLLAAARAEGTVSLITHPSVQWSGWVPVFERRFPEIKVERLNMRPSQVTPRLLAEQKNGVYNFDVMMAPTSNAVTSLSPAGTFQPLRPFVTLPDALDDARWHGGFAMWAEKDDQFTLVTGMTAERAVLVNRRIVPRAELATIDDLLNPKFRGRIAIYNPRAPNNGSLQLAAMLKDRDESFVRQVLQNGVYLDNTAQLAEFAASGRYPIGIGVDPEALEKLQEEGLAKDVEMTDLAFHAAAVGIQVLKNAPHPNAARLLVNWFLSQEGQEAYAREGRTVSRRADVQPQVAEGMARTAPDWNNLDRYVRANEWQGLPLVERVTEIAKEVRP